MMRVLVTGSEGFVGRHFARCLRDAGHMVIGVDIADPFVPLDARAFFDVDLAQDTHWDLVIHCAAVIGGRLGIEDHPAMLLAEDVSLDAAMFRWALRKRPDRVVYLSSAAAYPAHLQLQPGQPLTEDDIDLDVVSAPETTYGWSKLHGEQMARAAVRAGLRVHIFRPFSGYGEDQSLDYPFPALMDRARRKADPFVIWGDGEQVRDWIHVDDIVGAVMAALTYDITGPVNLGWGEPVSFGELAMLTFELAGYTPAVELRPDMPAGSPFRYCDNRKLLSFYTPRVSLEEGIARSLSLQPAT